MIAIDAMGGDNAPHAIVQGAIVAARNGIPLLLCGNASVLESLLSDQDSDWRSLPIEIEACSQEVTMAEDPRWIIKKKSDASLVKAMRAVVDGRAKAFLSAGNSGAVLVASIMLSGRVPGIIRPAIGGFLPTRRRTIFCLDLGANVDCSAEFLYQFAHMGSVYVQLMKGIERPRIALLSNGHEPYKGSAVVQKAYDFLAASSLNFVGNIEARDLFNDDADVLVCDGFTGNVLLKTVQGTARALFTWMKDVSEQASLMQRIFLKLNGRLFAAVKKKTDYAAVGGALLLGVQHPVVIAHGSSDARAITNAIMFAHDIVQKKIVTNFNERLSVKIAMAGSDIKTSAYVGGQELSSSVDHEALL